MELPVHKLIKISAALLVAGSGLNAHAEAQAYLQSTVTGVTINNAHALLSDKDGQPLVMRGRTPAPEEFAQLKNVGITDVLIFKNDIKGETETEKADLAKAGFESTRIHLIPMPWKNMPDYKTSCLMVVDALKLIDESMKSEGHIFFHCTAGEDRTGLLAGMFRIEHEGMSVEDAFAKEMCANGYEHGNHGKPFLAVVGPIRKGLTPLYVAMARRLAASGLSPSICEEEPAPLTPAEHDAYKCK
jgi:protein-tyrosine phosphatase